MKSKQARGAARSAPSAIDQDKRAEAHMRTVPSAVIRERTSFIWLFASVMSMEIWAR